MFFHRAILKRNTLATKNPNALLHQYIALSNLNAQRAFATKNYMRDTTNLILDLKKIVGNQHVISGQNIMKLTTGFRGKTGSALAAVSPNSANSAYQVMQLLKTKSIGFVIQGGNTSLKGQSTPNNDAEMPIVIIRTDRMKAIKQFFKISDDIAVIIAEPGASLKEIEKICKPRGFEEPYRLGSHDFKNRLGGGAAILCGGMNVPSLPGGPTRTLSETEGCISITPSGDIYNGLFKAETNLLERFDSGNFSYDDLKTPDAEEPARFTKSLFKSTENGHYPMQNKRRDLASGVGGEGSSFMLGLMYIVRSLPKQTQTFMITFPKSPTVSKENFYNETVFSVGQDNPQQLPLKCESMGSDLVYQIVKNGICFAAVPALSMLPAALSNLFPTFLGWRKKCIASIPHYLDIESFMGKQLSRLFAPGPLLKPENFDEAVIIQAANYSTEEDNIAEFRKRINKFLVSHPDAIKVFEIKPHSNQEGILFNIRNVAALATLTRAIQTGGNLFAFDDAIEPGAMTNKYIQILTDKLHANFPGIHLEVYPYGHDIKKVSHNDWVIRIKDETTEKMRQATPEETAKIHVLQHDAMIEAGGRPHAEHGVGDFAATDAPRDELTKSLAFSLLFDPEDRGNPGGGWKAAREKAMADPDILSDAITMAQAIIKTEVQKGTLLNQEGLLTQEKLESRLKENIHALSTQTTIPRPGQA